MLQQQYFTDVLIMLTVAVSNEYSNNRYLESLSI